MVNQSYTSFPECGHPTPESSFELTFIYLIMMELAMRLETCLHEIFTLYVAFLFVSIFFSVRILFSFSEAFLFVLTLFCSLVED